MVNQLRRLLILSHTQILTLQVLINQFFVGAALAAHGVLLEDAESKLASRNRRLADAMTSASEARAAYERQEAEMTVMKAEWEQARTALNKASDVEEDRELLHEQHLSMKVSLAAAVDASQVAEKRARQADAEADSLREDMGRLEGLLEEAGLREEVAATQRGVLEGA